MFRARGSSCLNQVGRNDQNDGFEGIHRIVSECGMDETRVKGDLRVSQVWGLKDFYREDPIYSDGWKVFWTGH